MRLSVFLLLVVGASLVVGGVSGLSGAGFWPSIGRAVATLVILQVGYFVFLLLAARKSDQSEVGDNGE